MVKKDRVAISIFCICPNTGCEARGKIMSIIEVHNLSKTYKFHKKEPGLMGSIKSLLARKYEENKAVQNISFSVQEGEFVGFIGPNGAGKTTTLKMLSGLLYPASGTAEVLRFVPWQRKEAFLRQIALVMGQKYQLWWDIPAMESFILNKEIYGVNNSDFKAKVDELSTLLEVHDLLNVQVRKLSLGERMKCELIASLIHSPRILFLDEPTIGLDVVSQKKTRDFLLDYNRRNKTTIILTSHYMADIQELCKRLIIIEKGKLVFDGPTDMIMERFVHHKILTIVFSQPIDTGTLSSFGEILKLNEVKAVVKVPRGEAKAISSKILTSFAVEDLLIEEPRIEDIIRTIFEVGYCHAEKI